MEKIKPSNIRLVLAVLATFFCAYDVCVFWVMEATQRCSYFPSAYKAACADGTVQVVLLLPVCSQWECGPGITALR